VLILQHPTEEDIALSSVPLLLACLPNAKVVVGSAWKTFADAVGEPGADPKRWAVLFPESEAAPGEVTQRGKVVFDAKELDGIVVLDGTWSKAKTLWWKNSWLSRMNRLTIQPTQPTIYGSLRATPRRNYVSTLESVAYALTLCGEDPAIEKTLFRAFRTMVQRIRDANIIPPPTRTGGTRKTRTARKKRAGYVPPTPTTA
jgi:hypothetical protein